MSDPYCYCGHALDEHEDGAACDVAGCPCVHFDEDLAEDDE